MSVGKWLRNLLGGGDAEGGATSGTQHSELPPEAVGAASSEEIAADLGQFHEANTRNEVLLRQIQRELAALDARERRQVEEVRTAEPESFAQRLGLQEIDRIRQRKTALQQRADIYQTNIRQNNEMIHKAEMLLSLREKGVSAEQITRMEVDFQTEFEQWRRERIGTEPTHDPSKEVISELDRKRLEQVERDVLGDVKLFARGGPVKSSKVAPKDEELRQMVESAEAKATVPSGEPAKREVAKDANEATEKA